MAKTAKKKISTLEILVSIFTVIFIFSLIGILNFQPKQNQVEIFEVVIESEPIFEEQTPTETATESSGEPVLIIEEITIVQERAELVAGTTLSSASSEFEVLP